MPFVIFIEPDGRDVEVDVPVGQSLMEAAKAAGVDGIVGQCGGSMRCGTCQCVVQPPFVENVGSPSDTEIGLIEAFGQRQEGHRLSCQLIMNDAWAGLTVTIPKGVF